MFNLLYKTWVFQLLVYIVEKLKLAPLFHPRRWWHLKMTIPMLRAPRIHFKRTHKWVRKLKGPGAWSNSVLEIHLMKHKKWWKLWCYSKSNTSTNIGWHILGIWSIKLLALYCALKLPTLGFSLIVLPLVFHQKAQVFIRFVVVGLRLFVLFV